MKPKKSRHGKKEERVEGFPNSKQPVMAGRSGSAVKERQEEEEGQEYSTEPVLESELYYEEEPEEEEEFSEEDDVMAPLDFDHHSDGTGLRGLYGKGRGGYGFDYAREDWD
jgi:hypothetical protein